MYDRVPRGQKMSIRQRFWSKVNKTETCWLWQGAIWKSHGYGAFSYQGKNVRAHRFSYELHYGPIPEEMHVCHTCDNPACVNPEHLFLGTNADNVADKVKKGRCPTGDKNGMRKHPESAKRGEAINTAKLTEADVLAIRALAATTTQKQLASQFGVGQTAIQSILTRKSWKHI
jgi:hypothetical protein